MNNYQNPNSNFNRKPKVVKKDYTAKPKTVTKDLYHNFIGKIVICVQKGNILLKGTFHSYEKGVMLFVNAQITYNHLNPEHATLTVPYSTILVDKTAVQMMHEFVED